MEEAILYPLPPPSDVVPRRLTDAETARVDLLCRLLFVGPQPLPRARLLTRPVPGHSSHQVVVTPAERELSVTCNAIVLF